MPEAEQVGSQQMPQHDADAPDGMTDTKNSPPEYEKVLMTNTTSINTGANSLEVDTNIE